MTGRQRNPETAFEPLQHLTRLEHLRPRCCQLDGLRQTVETAHKSGDRVGVVAIEDELGSYALRSLDEKGDGR